MKIRLGYACISETQDFNYKTCTYQRYQEQGKQKLEEIFFF